MRTLLCLLLLSAFGSSRAQGDSSPVILPESDRPALHAAVHAMCREQVALLGEAPTHGDGHTVAFKVALVEALVSDCGFKAIAFESSLYQFIDFNRALQNRTATEDSLSAAVGGMWKFDREFQPLVPFLLEKAKMGQVQIAGLDYQVGILGQDYTNEGMFTELTANLNAERGAACRADFHRYVMSDYPDGKPYSQHEHDALLQCLQQMQSMVQDGKTVRAEQQAEMLDNLQRLIESDLGKGPQRYAVRERTLYENFDLFTRHLPRKTKIIVWGASVHFANNPESVTKSAPDHSAGTQIKARYGSRAFALGFAAAGGSYRSGKAKRPVETPPANSLETQALVKTGEDAVYVSGQELKKFGDVPSYALEHKLLRADWSQVFDGVVVLREEWPTHNTRPGYE